MAYDFEKGCLVLLEEKKAKFIRLDPENPDTKWDAVWTITVELTDNEAKELKDLGFNVKDDNSLKIKKPVMVKGKKNSPPKVVGRDGKTPIPGADVRDGAIVDVEVFAKKYPIAQYVSAFINTVQVLEEGVETLIKDKS